jgi:hypothetical protein
MKKEEGYGLGIEGVGFAIEGDGYAIDLNPVSIITRDGWDG